MLRALFALVPVKLLPAAPGVAFGVELNWNCEVGGYAVEKAVS